jgi:hypothetical protein
MVGNTELREIHGHRIGNVKIPFVAGKGDKYPFEKGILNAWQVCGMLVLDGTAPGAGCGLLVPVNCPVYQRF